MNDIISSWYFCVSLYFFLLLIRKNITNSKKKKSEGIIINAKINYWKVLSGTPTRYILEIEYETKNEKKNKRLITSGKFAKKYQNESYVPIVVVQDLNRVFFEEEDWKRQNLVLLFLIILTSPVLIVLLFSSLIKIISYIHEILAC